MTEPFLVRQTGRRSKPGFNFRNGEQGFQHLLEKLPAGAYTCDRDGLITFFNRHAVDLWGRAPKINDPVDRFCGSFKLFSVDGVPINHDKCWMALALEANKEYNGHEIIVERPDGSRLTALAHANPIRDDSGNLVGAVNVLVDITERKRAETVLIEADRSKDEFIATLAHELRNPLAPISNAVQILQMKIPAQSELRAAVDVIDRQVRQMTRLIGELLDIGRMTSNKLELLTEIVELADVLRMAVETSGPLIEKYGHEIAVSVPLNRVFLKADPMRVSQVIANLLNNAAKYTPRGGKIRLTAQQKEANTIEISVIDTGIGIDEEMLPRIFEMFTQADRSLERSNSGLGIGLSLAKQLVGMHGGTISAHSDGPGTGSTFTVGLPIVVDSDPSAADTPPGSAKSPGALRILVVDDSTDSAESMALLLRLMGHEVCTAHDGIEAVAAGEEFHPEMILLDIGMPRMNGYDAAREIRRHSWGKDTVIVALTGWGQESDLNRSKEAGFDHHIVKPVDPDILIQLIEQNQNRKRG